MADAIPVSATAATAASRSVSGDERRSSAQPPTTPASPSELNSPYRRQASFTTFPRSAGDEIHSTAGCRARRPNTLPPRSSAIPTSCAVRFTTRILRAQRKPEQLLQSRQRRVGPAVQHRRHPDLLRPLAVLAQVVHEHALLRPQPEL